MTRLRLAVSFAVAAVVSGCGGSVGSTPPAGPRVPPMGKIAHVVIMVQENRSFDNLFAGFPGADTTMQGLCKPDPPKTPWCKTEHEVPLKSIKLEDGHIPGGKDICHSHQCFEIECDYDHAASTCLMDGFDLISLGEVFDPQRPAKLYPYSYIKRAETKPYWDLARKYTLADRMFFTDTASSFIAHQELIAGTVRLDDDESLTDQPDAMPWGCDAPKGTQVDILLRDGREFQAPRRHSQGPPYLPFPCFTQYQTMADLFDAAHTSWKFYVAWMFGRKSDFSGDVWNGFDAIKKVRYGPDWSHISRPNTTFFTDIKRGALPQVSWVIPSLCDSDHPASGANRGPRWVTQVVNAIGTSKYWKDTAIVLLWDDWGGWYDNAPPPRVNYTSLGFRVPMLVISPYARPHYVSHTQYDFGSVLKFVEQNFGLGSLGTTDATANSMADVFDFTQKPSAFEPAPLPRVRSCPRNSPSEFIEENGAPPG